MATKSDFANRCSLFAFRCPHLASGTWRLAIVLWLLTFPLTVVSQVKIQGTVTDKPTGNSLPGANIVLENPSGMAVSDENGRYVIQNIHLQELHKGPQQASKNLITSIRVSYIGYKTIVRKINLVHDTIMDFNLEPSPILGEEVNIVATRAGKTTPTTFSTLTTGEISSLNLGRDMPYILQSTPSVVTTSDAGTGIGYTSISIRGSDLTRINVTMNGIPVNDAETQGVWFVDLPDLASSSQNIQVQRGVGTSTNGAGAFGASINIQTSNLSEVPFAELHASAGSFGTVRGTLKFGSGLLAGRFAVDGRASWITSDGYIDRAWAKLRSFALSAGFLGNRTTVKFNLLSGYEKTYQAWSGVPGDSLETNRRYNPSGEYTDDAGNIAYYDNQTDNYNQDHYQLLFSQEITHKLNINAALFLTHGKGYYENYKSDQSYSSYGLSDVVIGSDTITSTDMITQKWLDNYFYGITFSGNFNPTQKLQFTLGGAWTDYYGKHFGKIIWAQYASGSTNDYNWYYNTGDKRDFNIYLKMNWRILKRMNLFADLQYRNITYAINGILDDLRPVNQKHIFNFFNPKAGVFFNLNDRQELYFSFAVGNREPNRNNFELADSSNMPQPERLYDYELGYNLKLPSFNAGICLYYMDYHDQLVLTGRINNVGEPVMTNVPESFRTGMEINAGAGIFQWLKWNISSTFSLNRIKNFTEFVDDYDQDWNLIGQTSRSLGATDISFSPAIIATNSFIFLPVKNLSIALNSRYVGRQYIDNTSSKSRSLDPYFINGITIGYDFTVRYFRNIGLTLAVNNLFSSEYESNAWVYRYNLAGQPFEMNGYFPQALINFLFGISVRI